MNDEPIRCPQCDAGPGRQTVIYDHNYGLPFATGKAECEVCRCVYDVKRVTFHLRDYLVPRGKYPYKDLAPEMERALATGKEVSLISVPGFLMASGHPSLIEQGCPWSDGTSWYATAQDCIDKRNRIQGDS